MSQPLIVNIAIFFDQLIVIYDGQLFGSVPLLTLNTSKDIARVTHFLRVY